MDEIKYCIIHTTQTVEHYKVPDISEFSLDKVPSMERLERVLSDHTLVDTYQKITYHIKQIKKYDALKIKNVLITIYNFLNTKEQHSTSIINKLWNTIHSKK